MATNFKSGFVSIVGRPNVGKSTLMNNIIGEKLSITSVKPQTTRNKIQTVLIKEDFQIIFIDTPGMHKSKSNLGNYMNKSANTTLNEVDVVLYLVEPLDYISNKEKEVLERLNGVKTPVFLIINKIDIIEKSSILKIIENYKNIYDFNEIIPISALENKNIDLMLECIKCVLPEGPKYYEEHVITNQPERQLVAEFLREKALYLLQEEIPHGIAVEVTSMKRRENIINIDATIYCEKESHKGIVIGKGGSMLKSIGSKARLDIQKLLGKKVNLQLWVKVRKDWRDDKNSLKNFGYDIKNI